MLTREDIETMTGYEYYSQASQPLTPTMYSGWVETMMLTPGDKRLIENTLGLVGEAGEFAEKIKKFFRDGVIEDDLVKKELGDVLFYITALANYFNTNLQEVMDDNVKKLNDRKSRGTLQGSGDKR
jgi:NTP pyrophosphatase (non-canonical NTP hydrolase)